MGSYSVTARLELLSRLRRSVETEHLDRWRRGLNRFRCSRGITCASTVSGTSWPVLVGRDAPGTWSTSRGWSCPGCCHSHARGLHVGDQLVATNQIKTHVATVSQPPQPDGTTTCASARSSRNRQVDENNRPTDRRERSGGARSAHTSAVKIDGRVAGEDRTPRLPRIGA